MKITVEKLRKNLELLEAVIPKKATLPITKNVRVADGAIIATDLETAVIIAMPEAAGQNFLLSLKQLLPVLKYIPGYDLLDIDISMDKKVKLTWENGSATFDRADEAEYPIIKEHDTRAEGVLNGDLLINALAAAVPYCATDDKRPVLTGPCIYLGNVLQVAGADGFRISFQSLAMSYPSKEKITIHPGMIKVLENLWKKMPAPAPLEKTLVGQLTRKRNLTLTLWGGEQRNDDQPVTPDHLSVKFGGVTVMAHLIMGTPVDHLQHLHGMNEPIKVRFMAPELNNAVRRVMAVSRDGDGAIMLNWSDAQMTVSANHEGNKVEASFPVEAGSNPGRIAINRSYLLDYLTGKDGLITMGMDKGSAPALFHFGDRPIVAIMPMFIQWPGDEVPAPQPTPEEPQEPAAAEASPQTEDSEEGDQKEAEEEEAVPAGAEE